MTEELKTYKRYGAAIKAAQGQPIVRVGNLYIVGVDSITEVALICPKGGVAGNVTLRHLDRLGNANHAVRAPGPKGNKHYVAFPESSHLYGYGPEHCDGNPKAWPLQRFDAGAPNKVQDNLSDHCKEEREGRKETDGAFPIAQLGDALDELKKPTGWQCPNCATEF